MKKHSAKNLRALKTKLKAKEEYLDKLTSRNGWLDEFEIIRTKREIQELKDRISKGAIAPLTTY